MKRLLVPMVIALVVGSIAAVSSSVLLARLFDLGMPATLALAPKSATVAIAMGIGEKNRRRPGACRGADDHDRDYRRNRGHAADEYPAA